MEDKSSSVETTTEKQPSDLIQNISLFGKRNAQCKISYDDECLTIEHPFGYDDSQLVFKKSETLVINDLEHIELRPEFDSILHHDTNQVEFIFGFLFPEKSEAYLNRKFKVHFEGVELECEFAEPTTRLMRLAQGFKTLPSVTGKGEEAGYQLRYFRDFQKLDEMPEKIREYFGQRVPRSFFVRPVNRNISDLDITGLAQHLNFTMNYYDRKTPRIIVRKREDTTERKAIEGLQFIEGKFPSVLSIRTLEPLPLQLLEVGRKSEPRIAFLYCYQVFEFAGIHYMDQKAKAALLRILRDPAAYDNLPAKLGEVHSIFADTIFKNDEANMEKVLEESCDPSILWREVECNKAFFANECEFGGGFKLPALVSTSMDLDGWKAMWSPKLFKHLTKIRNCLVHAREKREPNSIVPDASNDLKLAQFLPVIRRMAEQVVLIGGDP